MWSKDGLKIGVIMREILFKAKRKDNGEWIEGYYYKRVHVDKIVDAIEKYNGTIDSIEYYEIDPNTLCQLVPNDEVRVWENDIVCWEEDNEVISVVRYDIEAAKFVFDDYGTKGCLMEYGWDEDAGGFGVVDTYGFDYFYSLHFKVIGNIFDNPELIGRQ